VNFTHSLLAILASWRSDCLFQRAAKSTSEKSTTVILSEAKDPTLRVGSFGLRPQDDSGFRTRSEITIRHADSPITSVSRADVAPAKRNGRTSGFERRPRRPACEAVAAVLMGALSACGATSAGSSGDAGQVTYVPAHCLFKPLCEVDRIAAPVAAVNCGGQDFTDHCPPNCIGYCSPTAEQIRNQPTRLAETDAGIFQSTYMCYYAPITKTKGQRLCSEVGTAVAPHGIWHSCSADEPNPCH
jgi:hypothetical protein